MELIDGINSLKNFEFSVFSQFSDDGIIQWLVNNLDIQNKTFIEFGVENFSESNTRFLMMNDNWSGFVMDGSDDNINRLSFIGCNSAGNNAYFVRNDKVNERIKVLFNFSKGIIITRFYLLNFGPNIGDGYMVI